MAITDSYRDSREIIKISDIIDKYHKTYETIIVTFQSRVLPGLLENNLIKPIDDLSFGSAHGKYPIYELTSNPKVIFYLSPIGAPTTVGNLEEITYKLGVKNIIMYGSSGVLDKEITSGKIIVPTKAYRDEGTSYHYLPASDFIDVPNYEKVSKILGQSKIEYVEGYTWTTDAFYRETESLFQERKQQGCIAVEMEVSAVCAFAKVRKLELYVFIYGADNLDSQKWDKRVLGNLSVDERMKYFFVAQEVSKVITK